MLITNIHHWSISTLIKKIFFLNSLLFSALSLIARPTAKVKKGLCIVDFTIIDSMVRVGYEDSTCEAEYWLSLQKLEKMTQELRIYAEKQEKFTSWELNQKFIEQTAKIFSLVLGPVRSEITERIELRLEGELLSIPWYGLVKARGAENRYLIDDHLIELKPKHINYNKRSIAKRNVLFIKPNYKHKANLNSRKEKKCFKKYGMRLSLRDTFGRYETTATTKEYKFGVTHFSGHTYAQEAKQEIGLLLNEDSLSAFRISKMSATSNIVFLNACSTAASPQTKDFRYSLCGSFLETGSNTCIGTLWKIEDQDAAGVSEQFYNSLSKGKSTGASLRDALLYLKEDQSVKMNNHNFSWAAYQAFGEEQYLSGTIEYKVKSLLSFLASFLTTFSILSFYFGKRLKRFAIENNWV